MKLSNRAKSIQESPIRKLAPYAEKAKERGTHIYHLNIGQPDIETPREMLDVYANFDGKVLAYGPSQGLEEYRKNLVYYYARHGIVIEKEDIIVTVAGSEAIIFALTATCNYGDEIIIPEPFYTNYNGFATMAGVNIVPLTTYAEDGFALPGNEDIQAAITPKTRAIVICNPGNPTGAVYTAQDIKRLTEIARKHNLYVIADEVYREFVYDGLSHTSILDVDGFSEHAIVVDSVSKRYSACGARVGCIVSRNKELMKSVLKFAQARLCPPTLDQMAANAATKLDKSYFDSVLAEYDKRRNIVYEELQKIDGVVCEKPRGAFYFIAKLPIKNAENFAKWILSEFSIENETVMFAPAQGFYATPGLGEDEVRLAYVLNENALKKAMYIFKKGLEVYKQKE